MITHLTREKVIRQKREKTIRQKRGRIITNIQGLIHQSQKGTNLLSIQIITHQIRMMITHQIEGIHPVNNDDLTAQARMIIIERPYD